jgi:glycosyltransferase involved in cell wall biosynthesis
MRILIAHNFYQQAGGEDAVVNAEAAMLKARGHYVEFYSRYNDEITCMPVIELAKQTIWSNQTSNDFAYLIENFKPEVIHVHNTLPLISPSIYWVAARANIPVVQTLHNFRLLCPQAMLLRNGRLCEDCLGKLPWRSVIHRCYRESRSQSAVLASMLTFHTAIGTWKNKVTRYIALVEYSKKKFIEGGIEEAKIVVKPNFIESPISTNAERAGFLFVGRLSQEKGISILTQAARLLNGVSIIIAGIGPEAALLNNINGVQSLGSLLNNHVYDKMFQSTALILPSICYENFPRTLVEAFACGLPVIASRIGALAELVEDGVTGLLFEPGDAKDLASKMDWAQQNPEKMLEMGLNARKEYDEKYTAEKNYHQLMAIYEDAINASKNDIN